MLALVMKKAYARDDNVDGRNVVGENDAVMIRNLPLQPSAVGRCSAEEAGW
jgi:hypothetical protein